jgi:PEP-CTERM motif
MTRRGELGTLASVLMLCIGLTATASAGTITCIAQECTHTRDVTVYFGTLTVIGAPASNVDLVSFSDTITGTLAGQIFNDLSVDARVRNGLAPWIDGVTTDIDWVDAASQNLPAQTNLLNGYAAQAATLDGTYGAGYLNVLSSSVDLGPVTYTIATWFTEESGCGGTCQIKNTGNASVTFYLQDATWTAPAAAVPEPGTLPLLFSGLACVALLARRRNSHWRLP